jgi:hypothetical protein
VSTKAQLNLPKPSSKNKEMSSVLVLWEDKIRNKVQTTRKKKQTRKSHYQQQQENRKQSIFKI